MRSQVLSQGVQVVSMGKASHHDQMLELVKRYYSTWPEQEECIVMMHTRDTIFSSWSCVQRNQLHNKLIGCHSSFLHSPCDEARSCASPSYLLHLLNFLHSKACLESCHFTSFLCRCVRRLQECADELRLRISTPGWSRYAVEAEVINNDQELSWSRMIITSE